MGRALAGDSHTLTEGHQVIAVQYGLDSQAADVAATKRALGRVSGPVILVGHRMAGLSSLLPESMIA